MKVLILRPFRKDTIYFRTIEEREKIKYNHSPASGVVVYSFQTSSPPKPLGQSKPNFMWSLLGKGGPKFV